MKKAAAADLKFQVHGASVECGARPFYVESCSLIALDDMMGLGWVEFPDRRSQMVLNLKYRPHESVANYY